MLLAVAEQCAQALDRARLYRSEQRIAETLQLSLLPQQLPQFARLALAAQYLPGTAGTSAGGDWYDVVELDDSRVAVAVGDVVGQGPAAAAVMGQLRSALSAALLQGHGPAQALELLDRFAGRLPGALASTAACVVLDWSTGDIRWARAGHPPPVVVTADGARLLDGKGAGPVLGVPGRGPYGEGSTRLIPGATLLLYTDGLVERRREHLDQGLGRLTREAGRLAAAAPEQLTRELLAAVLADSAQSDDVAVLAVRLLPPPLHGSLPADPTRLSGVRRAVTDWARATGLPEDTTEDLQLALGEALANAVEHAYPGGEAGQCRWSVERSLSGDLLVCVEDRGTWRPPPADRGHRGRGLELIAALALDVEVRWDGSGPGASGTAVSFRLPAPGPVPARVPRRLGPPDPAGSEAAPDGEVRLAATQGTEGLVLALSGDLDLASAGPLGAELRAHLAALPTGAPVTLDLRRTRYLARERGIRLRLRVEPGGVPARVLRLTGVDALLPQG
jgi:anti-sigma regulatory factor (Ser/Thr protein kinase)